MTCKVNARSLRLNVDALARIKSDVAHRELLQLSQRLEIFEERRKEEILTTTFIAFDAIAAVVGARKEGFASEQIRGCFPAEWGDSTVEIPTVLISVLAEAWMRYKEDYSTRSMGQSFGLEATSTNTRKMMTTCEDADRHLRLANAVELAYWAASTSEQPISFETAIAQVSEARGASYEVVRRAHSKYKDHVRKQLITFGLLKHVGSLPTSGT
jgi:hypothetical protein